MAKSKNELDIIKSAQNKNEEAWYSLISKYSKTVWFAISKYNFKSEEREDVFQEVFLRLVKSLNSYKTDISKFSTFITTITNRTCIDKLRKDKKRHEVSLNHGDLEILPLIENGKNCDELNMDLFRTLSNALKELPPNGRLVIQLFYVKKYSYRQIAGLLNKDFNWVKNTLHRTRILLKQRLANMD